MVVIEIDLLIAILLDTSNLLSNNDFCKIDCWVFYFNVEILFLLYLLFFLVLLFLKFFYIFLLNSWVWSFS